MLACTQYSLNLPKLASQRAVLLAWLKTLPAGSRIGMESTGGYHELLAHLAHRRALSVYVLTAKDVRHDGQATGQRAKTDRVDAALVARYVAKEHEHLHL